MYVTKKHFLVVSSKDRDVTKYPSSSNFVIGLNNPFKSIYKIELLHATLPDKNSISSEPYLVLNIDELTSNTISSNDTVIEKSFAILYPVIPVTSGSFMQLDSKVFEHTGVEYTITPKASLSKISIKITDNDGNIFSFGGDNTLTKDYQCTFIFQITTLEVPTTKLDVQIV